MTEALTAPTPGARTARIPEWSFADRIRKIRREVVRVDQAAFARDLGVTKQAYSAWESGRNEPRSILALAKKVELVSGVPAAWLLGVESAQPITEPNTRRYSAGTSGARTALTLVRDRAADYRYVAAEDHGRVTDSTKGVNHAHAA